MTNFHLPLFHLVLAVSVLGAVGVRLEDYRIGDMQQARFSRIRRVELGVLRSACRGALDASFGAWAGRNGDELEYQQRMRDEWPK